MLNGGDDTGGDEVVMLMMLYLIDDDDCVCVICMITPSYTAPPFLGCESLGMSAL
jgi:hypothetical protein